MKNHKTMMKNFTRRPNNTFSFAKAALLLFVAISVLTSCKKDKDEKPDSPPVTTAVYVLNQGAFNANNSTVTMYDLITGTATTDVYYNNNEQSLGDVGSDLLIYGGKTYIVTNISSQLEILNSATFKHIKRIPFIKNNLPQQPSALAAYNGKVFVAAYDGTVTVIDTTTLEAVKEIAVGLNPDALLAAHGKIWVSNSGGLNFPDYDNTVSVIDPLTLTEVTKVTVGTNPFTLQADNYGDVYVITRGNYGAEKSRLNIIDASTLTLKSTFTDFEAYNFSISADTAYVYFHDFMGGTGTKIMTLNVKTEEIISSDFITDETTIQVPFSIAADPISKDIFIGDAIDFQSPGKMYRFGTDGKLKSSFTTGVMPYVIRFVSK